MSIRNQTAPIDINTAGAANTIVTGVAGKRIVVIGYALVNGVATAQSVQWKSGTNNLSGVMNLPSAIGGTFIVPDTETATFIADVGADLKITLSAATQVGGHVAYWLK